MKKLFAALTFLLVPALAHAVLFNGNFEQGLTGWTTLGDASVVDSLLGVDPPQGRLQALITTAPAETLGTCTCAYEHPLPYSGTNSAGFLVSVPFFDFAPLSEIHNHPEIIFDASGIKQSFVAETDIFLSFTWKFLTDEGAFPGALEGQGALTDPRFYVLDGVSQILFPTAVGPISPTPFAFEFPYETTTLYIPAGLHTLIFGVSDYGDHATNSGLLIDDISFRAVPESPAWWLLSLGFIGVARMIRRERVV